MYIRHTCYCMYSGFTRPCNLKGGEIKECFALLSIQEKKKNLMISLTKEVYGAI